MKKPGKYDLQVDFCYFDNRNVENISFSCEENWEKVLIKDTLNRKVGSCRSRSSTTKHDLNRLKMTVLEGIRKRLFSTAKNQNCKKKLICYIC